MKRNQVFESRYLQCDSEEVPEDQPVTVTIRDCKAEVIKSQQGEQKKPVLYFEEFKKPMVCNVTNWKVIEKLLGSDDSDDWIGQQITLYSADVEFGGDMMRGLRVKTKTIKKAPRKRAAEDEAQEEDGAEAPFVDPATGKPRF